jgi:hypothetical protein
MIARTLPTLAWDPTIPRRPLPPQGVTVQPQRIPGLLVIERDDPDVWIEWRRVCAIHERRAAQ